MSEILKAMEELGRAAEAMRLALARVHAAVGPGLAREQGWLHAATYQLPRLPSRPSPAAREFGSACLTVRAWNLLIMAGITTPAGLVDSDPGELLRHPNSGRATMRELADLRARILRGDVL